MMDMLNRFKKDQKDEKISEKDFVPVKELNKLKRVINTHQYHIDNIYQFYNLEPSGLLVEFGNIYYELMEYVDRICKKHDLSYWLDGYTLLDAIRHYEFQVWNDEIEIGMFKKDFIRFVEVFPSESDNSGLTGISCENMDSDVFQICLNSQDLGFDLVKINVRQYGDDLTDIIFPLQQIQLKKYISNIPNDVNQYLLQINPGSIKGLGNLRGSNQLVRFKKERELVDILKKSHSMLKQANNNFK